MQGDTIRSCLRFDLCLDVKRTSSERVVQGVDAGSVILYSHHGGSNQLWILEPVGEEGPDIVLIRVPGWGKDGGCVMTGLHDKAYVVPREDPIPSCHKWEVRRTPDGSVRFKCLHNDKYLGAQARYKDWRITMQNFVEHSAEQKWLPQGVWGVAPGHAHQLLVAGGEIEIAVAHGEQAAQSLTAAASRALKWSVSADDSLSTLRAQLISAQADLKCGLVNRYHDGALVFNGIVRRAALTVADLRGGAVAFRQHAEAADRQIDCVQQRLAPPGALDALVKTLKVQKEERVALAKVQRGATYAGGAGALALGLWIATDIALSGGAVTLIGAAVGGAAVVGGAAGGAAVANYHAAQRTIMEMAREAQVDRDHLWDMTCGTYQAVLGARALLYLLCSKLTHVIAACDQVGQSDVERLQQALSHLTRTDNSAEVQVFGLSNAVLTELESLVQMGLRV